MQGLGVNSRHGGKIKRAPQAVEPKGAAGAGVMG
jgi:hypothetical protein